MEFQKFLIELILIIKRKKLNKGEVIFIEETRVKVKYEFTYLDYLYFCDREEWRRIINGEYPIEKEETLIKVNENSAN